MLGQLKASLGAAALDWCWATKYVVPWSGDPVGDKVPAAHAMKVQGQDYGRFVKLRYRSSDAGPFEDELRCLETTHGWHVHTRDYDLVDDLGSDRYVPTEQLSGLGLQQQHQRRTRRAEGLASFLHLGLLLALDTLVQDGNEWRFEVNDHKENPTKTSFQSMLHLMCNLTDAKFVVPVRTPEGVVGVITSL